MVWVKVGWLRAGVVAGVIAGLVGPTPMRLASATPSAPQPLAGFVVGIDPGHNGRNWAYPNYLHQQVWNGREWEDCDTTGTSTNGGYPEHRFAFRVAEYLRRDLQRDGATVVMTRTNNQGHGPCVDRRAKKLNAGHSDIAIDIHGDGGPSSGRGFAILEPVRDRQNRHVITSSARFGRFLRHAVLTGTRMPTSTYDGQDGIAHRSDLAGLNLATEPKVLIECGNMRNATDARMMTSAAFQRRLARSMEAAIRWYLTHPA
ncbi:MAG: N-acetylmuramoyl-L-alanine amidase [Frankiaceae bacterium]|nr:N-acetylmuramoyl-L-alanine amidase [Frankiaceae bacterium]